MGYSALVSTQFVERGDDYLRVASLSIALFDYLQTLPAEYRFYRSQKSLTRPSLACCLFVTIRYLSIIVLAISNFGFFAQTFTIESCKRFYLVPPVLKGLQTIVSQTILGVRAFNISSRNRYVGWGLFIMFATFTILGWFANLYRRYPVVGGSTQPVAPGNCAALTRAGGFSAYLFNLFTVVFDLTTLVISSYYLWRYSKPTTSNRMTQLIRIMLYEGLLYFVILTAVNIVNLMLYRLASMQLQSAAISLYYAVTWIMSQRILLRLRKASTSTAAGATESMVMTRHLTVGPAVSNALRAQFEPGHKTPIDEEFGSPTRSQDGDGEEDVGLDVQVRVEHNVTVEYDKSMYGRETYRKSKVQWEGAGKSKQ